VAIVYAGRIVALDTPAALLEGLGRELVELRVDGEPESAIAALREHRIAGPDAFTVGSTLTVPLRETSTSAALALIDELRLGRVLATRRPTLDDVYLRLTGDRLAEAA
jgi:ABC-2 type transport system ATP-binding protein